MSSEDDTRMSEVPFTNKTEDSPPSFENVLDELGMPGRFQIIQITVTLLALAQTSFSAMGYVFQGYTPPHVCNTINDTQLLSTYGLQNDSTARITYGSCDITVSTNQSGRMKDVAKLSCPKGRNFSDAEHTTWISEWDLVCESKGRAEFSFSVFTVGQVFGGLIASQVNDLFGRKPVYIACLLGGWIMESIIIFAPNIYVIIGIKFGSGFFQIAMVTCGYVFAMEFVAPRHRHVYGAITGVFWVFEVIIVGMFGYIFRDHPWQYFQGSAIASGTLSLLCFFFLNESPRWLAANGKIDEAVAILQKASKQNKKNPQKVKKLFLAYVDHTFPSTSPGALITQDGSCIDQKHVDSVGTNDKNESVSVLTLFKHKSLLITTLITTYIWVTHVLTYYGLYLTASNLAGDRFVNFILMILVEIPSLFCVMLLSRRFGRRVTIAIALGMTVVGLVASTLCSTFGQSLNGSDTLATVFFIIGKSAISISFTIIYTMTPELFPTNLRSTASGFCNSLSRVGGMVAPFMSVLYEVINWGPGMVFTVMCILAMVLVMFLPETKGMDLPSTLKEFLERRKKREIELEEKT